MSDPSQFDPFGGFADFDVLKSIPTEYDDLAPELPPERKGTLILTLDDRPALEVQYPWLKILMPETYPTTEYSDLRVRVRALLYNYQLNLSNLRLMYRDEQSRPQIPSPELHFHLHMKVC